MGQVKEFNLVIRLSTKGMLHSLSQLEKANIVQVSAMTKNGSGALVKKIQTVVVLGHKSVGVTSGGQGPDICGHSCYMKLPVLAAIEVSHVGVGEIYGIRYEGKIELPKLMNRLNVEKMVEESLKGGFRGELFFGKSNQMDSIKVVAQLEKTEELKREIRESPEFKQCLVDQGR